MALSPCFAPADINLASLAMEADRHAEAQALYLSVLEYAPHNLRARNGLAAAYFKDKQHELAIPQLQYILKRQPAKHKVRIGLGDCYWAIGKHQLAEDQYLYVVKNDPKNHLGYRKMSRCYLKSKKRRLAIEMLRKALALKPDDAIAMTQLEKLQGGPIVVPIRDLIMNAP